MLASIEDGFGMVLPQAMACGLPIICTENTGAADLIENEKQGFVVPIRNVSALKEKIIWLYENTSHRSHMAKEAKTKVCKGFSWDDYGKRIISSYKMCLNPSVPNIV